MSDMTETKAEQAVLDRDELAAAVIDDELVDRLVEQADAEGAELLGPGGLLTDLTRRVLERAMDVELTDHLGYERGDPAGRGSGNSRNGSSPKTVLTDAGEVRIHAPRDRGGTFDSKLVPKGRRRLDGFNDLVLSLVAKGMTMRDVCAHLSDVYGVSVSPELISKVTDSVWDELIEWQNRPLDECYPVLYVDALMVKVRDGGRVGKKPAYLAVGLDVTGHKHILGVWLGGGGEGAGFWLSVFTELRNRGVEDVLIACCDGLPGLADALEQTWPQVVVQTCVVHLLRGSARYCGWKDRKPVLAALRPIYTAPTVQAAEANMDHFEAAFGDRFPGVVKLWRDAWDRFVPFLDYPVSIRQVVYTTNMIESINFQLRKATRNRGAFPSDRSALKLLYIAVTRITTTRGGNLGTGSHGWRQAMNAFAIHFPGRLILE